MPGVTPIPLKLQPLTAEAFAPFGEIIQAGHHAPEEINQGHTRKYGELARVDAILADPKIYDGAPERVILLGKDKARFEGEIAKIEESWLEMSAALEDAEKAQA